MIICEKVELKLRAKTVFFALVYDYLVPQFDFFQQKGIIFFRPIAHFSLALCCCCSQMQHEWQYILFIIISDF